MASVVSTTMLNDGLKRAGNGVKPVCTALTRTRRRSKFLQIKSSQIISNHIKRNETELRISSWGIRSGTLNNSILNSITQTLYGRMDSKLMSTHFTLVVFSSWLISSASDPSLLEKSTKRIKNVPNHCLCIKNLVQMSGTLSYFENLFVLIGIWFWGTVSNGRSNV